MRVEEVVLRWCEKCKDRWGENVEEYDGVNYRINEMIVGKKFCFEQRGAEGVNDTNILMQWKHWRCLLRVKRISGNIVRFRASHGKV